MREKNPNRSGTAYAKLVDQDNSDRRVIIMRGIPGSGKSTLAAEFAKAEEDHVIVSADHHFMYGDEYRFNPAEIGEAHAMCQLRFVEALLERKKLIIVDNTNIHKWEFSFYKVVAYRFGYDVQIHQVWTDEEDVDLCIKRNIHGVPFGTILRMYDEMEYVPNARTHSMAYEGGAA